jgi:hypothetical protein
VSIRPKIEAALAATAERLSRGSGADAVRDAKNDLMTISASSDGFDRRYANEEISIAAPVVFESKHPDGDPVTFKKKQEGLIVVFPDSFIFVRAMGFGAREVKGLKTSEVSVERVTTDIDGTQVPGLRITGSMGKPKFAVAITQGSPTEQTAVRDEILALLAT